MADKGEEREMRLEKEREQVVRYCRKLISAGLTRGTGGNISIYNRREALMAISPSGMAYDEMTSGDVVVMDLNGNVIEGQRKPSSEYALHQVFYAGRRDIGAIVHAHSTYSCVLATLREGLPAASYLVALAGPDVRCAGYASFGTRELAREAFAAMQDRKAVFLANHGLLAAGESIGGAFQVAEEIEFCAKVYVKARSIGRPVILDDAEMSSMAERFKTYGQDRPAR